MWTLLYVFILISLCFWSFFAAFCWLILYLPMLFIHAAFTELLTGYRNRVVRSHSQQQSPSSSGSESSDIDPAINHFDPAVNRAKAEMQQEDIRLQEEQIAANEAHDMQSFSQHHELSSTQVDESSSWQDRLESEAIGSR